MEPQFKSSFIPKKDSVVTAVGNNRVPYRKAASGLLDKVAAILFVLTLLVWGGLFGYQKYIESQITSLGQDIANARMSINEEKVDLFVSLGKQVKLSKELLAQHLSLAPLFEFMEANTIPSVQFTEFTFTHAENGGLEVAAKGTAQSFADVARQEQVLREAQVLSNLLFDQITVDSLSESTGVIFNTSFTISRQSLLYTELVKDLVIPVPESAEAAESASSGDAPRTEPRSMRINEQSTANEPSVESLPDDDIDDLFDELDSF